MIKQVERKKTDVFSLQTLQNADFRDQIEVFSSTMCMDVIQSGSVHLSRRVIPNFDEFMRVFYQEMKLLRRSKRKKSYALTTLA